jgi:molecular chaperone GrpE
MFRLVSKLPVKVSSVMVAGKGLAGCRSSAGCTGTLMSNTWSSNTHKSSPYLHSIRYQLSTSASEAEALRDAVKNDPNVPPPTNSDGDAETPETPPPKAENIAEETIAALRAEVKDLKDKVLRGLAEEENVRRIAKRDVENAREYANTKFATALLEVSDNLELALASVPEAKRAEGDAAFNTLYQGIEITDKGLTKVFNHFHIVKYGKVGDKFDPAIHDALFRSPDATKEEGTISQVLKPGYKLKDRVIRAAQVGAYVKPSN